MRPKNGGMKPGPRPKRREDLAARGTFRKHPERDPERGKGGDSGAGEAGKTGGRDWAAEGLAYARAVVAGEVVAGRFTRLACERHLRDLSHEAEPDFAYRFDAAVANDFCRRMERYPHIKGRWAAKGQYLRLEAWQCFVVCSAFGWLRKSDGLRRFRELYLCVARKNAKSTLAAAIGINMLTEPNEHGGEVYSGATSEKQAWEVFGPARMMLLRAPELAAAEGVEVWAKAIVRTADNAKFWPVIGKPGDGMSPHCAIVDEFHEHETPDQVDTMVTGMGAREQPMLVIITTAGTNLASPCYDKHKEVEKLLEGTFEDERLFGVIYSADAEDDWADPKVLRKANPNMGVSVDEEYLISQQRQAVLNPAYQNRFKTKHLDIWCGASVAGINMHLWQLAGDAKLSLAQFEGAEAIFSLDLASKIDICSYVKLFAKKIDDATHYYAFCRHYLPEDTVAEAMANGQAYRKWVAMGRLLETPGAEIDFDLIREDVKADAKRYQCREVVYDPWRATQLAHQLAKDGATVVEIGQTAKNMGNAFDELLAALKAGRFHHDGDPVLEWMASNVIARQAIKGVVVPGKDKPEQKIDGIVALVMAIGRSLAEQPAEYRVMVL